MNLDTSVEKLKGVGEKTAGLFRKLNILTYEDLLMHFPVDYIIYDAPVSISECKNGRICSVKAAVCSVKGPVKAGRYTVINVVLKDGLNTLELVFFNQPYIKKILRVGGFYIFRGKIVQKGISLTMQNPRLFSSDDYNDLLRSPVPKYPLTSGLTSKTISKAMHAALLDACFDEDDLPSEWLQRFNLVTHKKALELIHFPSEMNDVAVGRRRLVFEEFLYFLLVLRKNRSVSMALPNSYRMIPTADAKRFIEALPFRLTAGQKRTWEQIEEDMCSDHCMNRLVQGDVGSGKTMVALLSLLMTCANGYQGALMAPTEVLASQHFKSVKEYTEKYGLIFKPVLLMGSMKASEKKEAYALIESGEANLVIGTHALIQEKVKYKDLALVVTDEQHRFGVRQREALAGKGNEPHILVMSATPIPRTLAIILYGDLSLSAIHEMPAGRQAIKNCVVGTSYRPSAYKFFKEQIALGHQVYVICPKVESDEEDDGELENVVDYCEKLKSILPGVNIEYLNGKMKPNDKNAIMNRFAEGTTDILVSTTVIEVGINVPNATVMMIENSERFGLAQLHQLRGRVGRGKDQSYCIFVTSKEDEKTMERLNILNSSNDGFNIASEDLKLRGPGELFGVRQSGEFSFKIADIYTDSSLLETVSNLTDEIYNEDPGLDDPKYKGVKKTVEAYIQRSHMFQSI